MPEQMTHATMSESIQGTIQFSNPEWLWMLPILLLSLFLWRSASHQRQSASLALGKVNFRYPVFHPLISLIPKIYTEKKAPTINIVVYGLMLASLIISLAEPVRIGSKLPEPPQERDIIFIVDTSISMTLRDYVLDGKRVDRMTILRNVMGRFIQQFQGERIGIIIFGDSAYTLVPLTSDQHLVRRMLSRIKATMVGRFNNMGEAIALAVKQSSTQTQGQRHQVLVMLTDADKPTGTIDPYTASDLAIDSSIPLYTISIGASVAEAEEKRVTGLIYEPVDTELLTEISERTGGKNYPAGNIEAFQAAVNDISENEMNQRSVPPLYYQDPLYYWPLFFGIGLFLCFTLVVVLKRSLDSTHSASPADKISGDHVNIK